mmetsp:Transcript_1919/g.2751  ORF Transcript_1919/g.2751 Transcript_1919/m.2751 type:complete len:691 (-) Transcript_1919:7-2079(-)
MKILLVFLILLNFSHSIVGVNETFYISLYGSDTNNGLSPSSPFLTLRKAFLSSSGSDVQFLLEQGLEYTSSGNIPDQPEYCGFDFTGIPTSSYTLTTYSTTAQHLSNTTINLSNCGGTGFAGIGNAGSMSITDITFTNSVLDSTSTGTRSSGGFILVLAGGSLHAQNCTFLAASVPSNGGAIYIEPSPTTTVNLQNCTFSDNQANKGGALFLAESTTAKPINIEHCLFFNNSALLEGGAIHNAASLVVSHSHFQTNTASQPGGAISLATNAYLDLESSCFVENLSAMDTGNGISVYGMLKYTNFVNTCYGFAASLLVQGPTAKATINDDGAVLTEISVRDGAQLHFGEKMHSASINRFSMYGETLTNCSRALTSPSNTTSVLITVESLQIEPNAASVINTCLISSYGMSNIQTNASLVFQNGPTSNIYKHQPFLSLTGVANLHISRDVLLQGEQLVDNPNEPSYERHLLISQGLVRFSSAVQMIGNVETGGIFSVYLQDNFQAVDVFGVLNIENTVSAVLAIEIDPLFDVPSNGQVNIFSYQEIHGNFYAAYLDNEDPTTRVRIASIDYENDHLQIYIEEVSIDNPLTGGEIFGITIGVLVMVVVVIIVCHYAYDKFYRDKMPEEAPLLDREAQETNTALYDSTTGFDSIDPAAVIEVSSDSDSDSIILAAVSQKDGVIDDDQDNHLHPL